VTLTVTREFGHTQMQKTTRPRAAGAETVISLLERNEHIATRYGGGFVQSIDGFSGGARSGAPTDWFYYVNGIQAAKGAAQTNVHPGDHIWWDLHDWSQAADIPAVVGSFPEPFLNGSEGKRLPVRVQCQTVASPPCQTVVRRLAQLGVPAATAGIGVTEGKQILRVLVGTWRGIQADPAAQKIDEGPRSSGVYARFSKNAQTLTLEDDQGQAVRTLSTAGGLIAATRYADESPIWVVTGTDNAGLELAARGFDAPTLKDHFAVAFSPTGPVALPQIGVSSR
jgi:hypothetical protein